MGHIHLNATKNPTVLVVGTPHYRDVLEALPIGEHKLELVPEPDNPYDNTAISVRHEDKVVGYIPAMDTGKYWKPLSRVSASGNVSLVKSRISEDKYGNRTVELFLPAGARSLPDAKIPKTGQALPAYGKKAPVKNSGCMKPWMWIILAAIIIFMIL